MIKKMGVLQRYVFVAVVFLEVMPSCSNNVPIAGIIHEDQTEEDEVHFKQRLNPVFSASPFYDVEFHGRCPRPNEKDWKYLAQYLNSNCSKRYEGSKFHCAKNAYGVYTMACAYPVACNKGKEPIIKYAAGHTELAEISCHWCPSTRFNPEEGKLSNTYPTCPEKRRECPSSEGQVECDIIMGVARHWTDSKCRCNITNNHIPLLKKANICKNDSLLCLEYTPCPDTADGRKQEYLSNYLCAPVCGNGFHPRTLNTDDCIPIENNLTTIYENTTSTTTTTTESSKTIITTQPDRNVTKTTLGNGNENLTGCGTPRIIIIVIAAVAVLTIVGYIVLWCRNHRKSSPMPRGGMEFLQENIPFIDWTQNLQSGSGSQKSDRMSSTGESSSKYLGKEGIESVLNRIIIIFKEKLDAEKTIEKIIQRELYTKTIRNDLHHMLTRMQLKPSDLNTEIWDIVRKNANLYYKFKKCLSDSGQDDLFLTLEKIEEQVGKENSCKDQSGASEYEYDIRTDLSVHDNHFDQSVADIDDSI